MSRRLITESIPNLVNGVSQQPPALRLSSQSEFEFNRLSSVVDGNKVRPPSIHVAKIGTGTLAEAHFKTINRDISERYTTILTGGEGILVNDIDGTSKTVSFAQHTRTSILNGVSNRSGNTTLINLHSDETGMTLTSVIVGTLTLTWEYADDAAFSVNLTTLRVDTVSTSAVAAWDPAALNGKYFRATISGWTAGSSVEAEFTLADVGYLSTAAPATDLQAVTVSDFTFIMNKSKATAMNTELSYEQLPSALINIETATYETTYWVYIDGTLRGTYLTGATGALSTTVVATDLYNDLVAALSVTFDFTVHGSVIEVSRKDSADFTVSVLDTKNNGNMSVVTTTVQDYVDLPTKAPPGYVVKVRGDDGSDKDDYYVEFVSDNSGFRLDRGNWEECVAPSVEYQIDEMTMPRGMVRLADGSFEVRTLVWDERTAGDLVSSITPSFIGNKINDMYLFKGRMGLVADTNIVLTESNEYFNWFRTTVTQVLDSDPIDISASQGRVSILRHAIPFDKTLLLLADQTQFRLEGGDILTAATAAADPTTEYEASINCSPIALGANIYFVANHGDYSTMLEYFIQDNSAGDNAADVTAHVPRYIPSGITKLTGNANSNFMAACEGSTADVYIYKYYSANNDKIQSAWSKWNFGDGIVLDISMIASDLYLLVQYADGYYTISIPVEDGYSDEIVGDSTYGHRMVYHLDRRITEADFVSAVYNAVTDTTAITLPYSMDAAETYQVVQYDFSGQTAGTLAQGLVQTSATVATVNGDYSTKRVYFGQKYTSSVRLSTFFIRQQSSTGGSTISQEGRVTINHINLTHTGAGAYDVEVKPGHTPATTYSFRGKTTGALLVGALPLENGEFTVPVLGENKTTSVTIQTDSFLPATFTTAEYEVLYSFRAGRR